MKQKRIRLVLHLCGREIFSLTFEWIERVLWGGLDLASPLPTGLFSIPRYANIKRNLLISCGACSHCKLRFFLASS